MTERALSLMYAVRPSVVCKYVAQLIFVQAGMILLPSLLAVFYAEYAMAARYFAMASLLALIAAPFIRAPVPAHVQTNEAITITVIP